jgi:hypothetical protein
MGFTILLFFYILQPMKKERKTAVSKLVEAQFDCLSAVYDNGALCPSLDNRNKPTGMFKALASSTVNAAHPGWPAGVVSALYLMRLLSKNESGEFTITPRGKAACVEYRAEMKRRAVIAASQANPDKIVLLSDYRNKGAS